MGDLVLGFLLGVAVGSIATAAVLRRIPRPAQQPLSQPAAPSHEEAVGASVLETMLSQESMADRLRQDLRVKLLYDEAKVNAAIEFERQRNPSASEEEWMQAAIFRWERENR
jgi:hypothetical protein